MDFTETIKQLIQTSALSKPDWNMVMASPLGFFLPEMKRTLQSSEFHGEGDVCIHTRMVCEALTADPDFYTLSDVQRTGLFAAAVFHDVGKVRTTRLEDEKWVSPRHSSTGSLMTREYLWMDCGLCGNMDRIRLRELICALVRYHMLPVHLIDQEDSERKAREIAAIGELVPDFSWKLLCMLSKADMQGRIASDIEEQLVKIELCQEVCREAGCFDAPYHFQDSYTKHAYLSGRNVMPEQSIYDDTWDEVILMSGLPGTGKDTWIRNYASECPIISLDDIRKELHVLPTDNQGVVIQEAQERAKAYLRKHQPFVWNATDITRDTRQKQISLFERYGARVRIVYLETDWDTQLQRNNSRADEVPVEAIGKMLGKTVLPLPEEAQAVEWIAV